MYKLVIEDDEGKTTVVPIIRDEITVGRKDGNTIRLTERNVSRRHAKLIKGDSGVQIEDVESRYGTKLNGQKLERGKSSDFREGDVVIIGDYRLSLQSDRKSEDKPKAGLQNRADAKEPQAQVSSAPAAEISPVEAAKIVVVSSNFAGREYSLTGAEMIIGRTEGDIQLDHRSISRNHAKFVREDGRYKVLDLNSANGVKVNGEEYRSVQLKRGDVIELGHVKFRFVDPGENFVFQPNSVVDEVDDIKPPSNNLMKFAALGVVALILVAFVVVIGIAIVGSQVTSDPTPKADAGAVVKPTIEDPPDGNAMSDELLKQADELAADEEWKGAIKIYDLVLKKDPGNDSARRKRSKASTELPFKENYDNGVKALDGGRYEEALKQFRAISSVSLYATRVDEKRLREKASEGAIKQYLSEARNAIDSKDWEEARNQANLVLELDPRNAEAKELRKEANSKDSGGGKENPATSKRPKNTTKKPKDKPKNTEPKLSREERAAKRAELMKEARGLILRGQPDQAIGLLNEAMKHGAGIKGYKMYALAYEKKRDQGNAIKYYNLWLKASCGHRLAPVVRKKIVAMGGTPTC